MTNQSESAGDVAFEGFPLVPFLRHFGIDDDERLKRLSIFLLAHSLLDGWLIHLLAIAEFPQCLREHLKEQQKSLHEAAQNDADAVLDKLITKHARGMFGSRLDQVRKLTLLEPEYADICGEINRGRNSFLHWMPGRFAVPRYREADVTTPEGFRQALADAAKVIRAIQENAPATGADPSAVRIPA